MNTPKNTELRGDPLISPELTQKWFMGKAQDCGDTIVAQFPLEIGTETRYIRVEIVKAELLRGDIEWSQV